jgi:hypothetical protein
MTLPHRYDTIHDADFEDMVDHMCRRPSMWVTDRTIGAVCAYLNGYDQARSGAPLFGLHQWLVVRTDAQNNIWWEATARQNLPEVDDSVDFEKDHRDIAALGRLLAEFFADRRTLGLAKILRAHEELLERRYQEPDSLDDSNGESENGRDS